MANHFIVLSVIICITLLNFMMWSGTNYGSNSIPAQVSQLYTSLLSQNSNSSSIESNMEEIREKLDAELEILKQLKVGSHSGSFEEHFMKMREYSANQVPLRKRTLAQIFKPQEYYLLYGALAPEVFCPEKVRVGTVGDGGKWVCNPWKVPKNTVLFSLGLNNYIGFEEEWQKMTENGNVLYGFDAAEQNPITRATYAKIRGTSKKALISVATDTSKSKYTIEDLAKEFNVTTIEILKIDIEGAELTCLIPFLEKYPVCQIYLELHGGAPEHAKLLREIAHLGYRLFSYEVNGFELKACEYSFIAETCIEKYGGLRIANYLDFKN
uniref:Methyltranfer_dom domain-containing protein n=1 Tax=Caenorhabditis tropicalis TaxID=1561998 RepID=A0A1I7TPT5_9PELO